MPPKPDDLETLAILGDVDGVLRQVTLGELADAWCRAGDEDEWATTIAFSIAHRRHPIAHAFLLALVERADRHELLCRIGAGPLEDFLSDDPDDLDWLEAAARDRPRLAQALAGVWAGRRVSEQTLARLDRIAGTPLARPRPREEWSPQLTELDAATTDLVALLQDPDAALDPTVFDRYRAAVEASEPPTRDDSTG